MRNTTKEYLRFLAIAQGSLAEIETQLHLCKRLGYGKIEELNNTMALAHRVGKMLNGLAQSLKAKILREYATSHQPLATSHP